MRKCLIKLSVMSLSLSLSLSPSEAETISVICALGSACASAAVSYVQWLNSRHFLFKDFEGMTKDGDLAQGQNQRRLLCWIRLQNHTQPYTTTLGPPKARLESMALQPDVQYSVGFSECVQRWALCCKQWSAYAARHCAMLYTKKHQSTCQHLSQLTLPRVLVALEAL